MAHSGVDDGGNHYKNERYTISHLIRYRFGTLVGIIAAIVVIWV